MSNIQGGINKNSPTTELELIRQKRAALQKLVKLTATLNNLHKGLQSVILMGKSVSQIPAKIIEKFKALTESLKSKPTETIKNTLTTTDQKIQRDIKHILELSQKSDELLAMQLGATGNKLVDVLKEDYHEYATDFKKKSQTSITLRIALKSRRETTKAFNLPVPESFIETQITTLNTREKECRERISKDMSSLQNDVTLLLNREDCPEEIRNFLNDMQTELQENADHFNSGKSLDEMPMIFESIELSATPQTVEEIEEQANPQLATATEEEHIEQDVKKPGFFGKVWRWLSSPLKTRWKDID